jgi:hypothetical protein
LSQLVVLLDGEVIIMKLALKFVDGTVATIEDFGGLPRERNGQDFLDNIQAIKDNNSPINLVQSSNGTEDFHATGKDLVAVEIILD